MRALVNDPLLESDPPARRAAAATVNTRPLFRPAKTRSGIGRATFARLLFLLLALLPSAHSWSASLTASLDRTSIAAGESVNLSLTFNGVSPPQAPRLPEISGLRYLDVERQSHISLVNGQMTSTTTFTYTLAATQPGEILIPAMSIALGNEQLTSAPLKLTVGPAGSGTDSGRPQLAFMRMNVPSQEVFEGEAFPLELNLYWQNAQDIRTPQVAADGFSLSSTPSHTQTRVQVGATPYNLLVFKYAATAARAGDLALGPAEASLTLLLRTGRSNDPFFDNFFGTMQRQPIVLTADAIPIKVLPLPAEGVPEWFAGAVGQYSMQVTAGPTNLAVGDPITVTVRIGGRGLLGSITMPDQPQWRDFKTYPASSRVETEDPLGLTGAKVFEQVIIPQNHEINVLPPVMFSYFDSAQRAYRTLSNAPVTLAVRHSSQVTVAPPGLTNATEEARPPADDLIHIRVRPDGPAAGRKPWVGQPGYYVILAIPALAWVGLTVARRRREVMANNPRLRRRREVQAKVRRILDEMRAQAAAADAEGVYAGMFRVLQEQLGERLDLPASAITEAVIDERLRGGGLEAAVLEELHALFQACNQARYAPSDAPLELAAWPPRLEAILPALEEFEP